MRMSSVLLLAGGAHVKNAEYEANKMKKKEGEKFII